MGLSVIPSSSEGILYFILANTVFSISMFKGLLRFLFRLLGFGLSSSSSSHSLLNPEIDEDAVEFSDFHVPSSDFRVPLSDCYVEEFRSRTPAIRFDALCCGKQLDCSVCLTEFEPESEINSLCCGHLFHKVCVEKWLDYWNITCPLCRTLLVPDEVTYCFW